MSLFDTLFSHLDDVVASQAKIERENQLVLGASSDFDYYWRVQQANSATR